MPGDQLAPIIEPPTPQASKGPVAFSPRTASRVLRLLFQSPITQKFLIEEHKRQELARLVRRYLTESERRDLIAPLAGEKGAKITEICKFVFPPEMPVVSRRREARLTIIWRVLGFTTKPTEIQTPGVFILAAAVHHKDLYNLCTEIIGDKSSYQLDQERHPITARLLKAFQMTAESHLNLSHYLAEKLADEIISYFPSEEDTYSNLLRLVGCSSVHAFNHLIRYICIEGLLEAKTLERKKAILDEWTKQCEAYQVELLFGDSARIARLSVLGNYLKSVFEHHREDGFDEQAKFTELAREHYQLLKDLGSRKLQSPHHSTERLENAYNLYIKNGLPTKVQKCQSLLLQLRTSPSQATHKINLNP